MIKKILTTLMLSCCLLGCSDTIIETTNNYKIKIIESNTTSELENKVNEWLLDEYEIVNMYYSSSKAGATYTVASTYSVLIYYKEVQEND